MNTIGSRIKKSEKANQIDTTGIGRFIKSDGC